MYSRRRRPEMLVVTMDPDDDIRENIIHYDEEGVGKWTRDLFQYEDYISRFRNSHYKDKMVIRPGALDHSNKYLS